MYTIKLSNREKLLVYGKASKLVTPRSGQQLPEHVVFLNSILTNDIKSLEVFRFCYSLMLSDKGYPVDDFFVLRTEDGFILDFEGDASKRVEKFNRLKLSLKVYFDVLNLHHYFIFGDGSGDYIKEHFGIQTLPQNFEFVKVGKAIVAKNPLRTGGEGYDILSEDELSLESSINHEEFESLRISRCVPKINKELKEGIIPLETNIWKYAISFTKGCYTGQEVIARIHYRGKLPRKMVKLKLQKIVEENSDIFFQDKKVGIVTSVSGSLEAIGFILSAYIKLDGVYNSGNTELKLIGECEDILNQNMED